MFVVVRVAAFTISTGLMLPVAMPPYAATASTFEERPTGKALPKEVCRVLPTSMVPTSKKLSICATLRLNVRWEFTGLGLDRPLK